MLKAAIWMWSGVLVALIYGFLSADHVGNIGQPSDIGGGGILLLGVLGFLIGAVLMIIELFKRWMPPKL